MSPILFDFLQQTKSSEDGRAGSQTAYNGQAAESCTVLSQHSGILAQLATFPKPFLAAAVRSGADG